MCSAVWWRPSGVVLRVDEAEVGGGGVDVLVAASGQVHDDDAVGAEAFPDPAGAGEGVRGLDGGDDALGTAEQAEGLHGLGVGDGFVDGSAGLCEVGVLGAHGRVVQARGDGVALPGLAVLVLQYEGTGAVEDAGAAGGDGGGGALGPGALSPGFEPVQGHFLVGDESSEDRHRVGAPAHTRGDGVGETAHPFLDLLAGLGADDVVQVAYELGEGVGTGDGPEEVMGVVDVGDPVAEGLVDGVLEGAAADGDRDALGAEHAHPGDVEGLAFGVLFTHVDDTVEAEEGAGGGGGYAVLSGTGLGDDAGLAHAFGEQGLAEHVVDL